MMDYKLFILPLEFILGLIAWITIYRMFWKERLNSLDQHKKIMVLSSIHLFRYIGLVFLVGGLFPVYEEGGTLPYRLAFGDLAASVTALIAIISLSNKTKYAIMLTWIFNSIGAVDLIAGVITGFPTVYADLGRAGSVPYVIITIYVPLMLFSHYLIFHQLIKYKKPHISQFNH